MTNKQLRCYFPLIELLVKKHISVNQFKSIISSINDNAIKFLCECCCNAISREYVLSMTSARKRYLLKVINPYKNIIKSLCRRKKYYNKSRRLLLQMGYGFSMPILASILPLLSSLIAGKHKT